MDTELAFGKYQSAGQTTYLIKHVMEGLGELVGNIIIKENPFRHSDGEHGVSADTPLILWHNSGRMTFPFYPEYVVHGQDFAGRFRGEFYWTGKDFSDELSALFYKEIVGCLEYFFSAEFSEKKSRASPLPGKTI